MVRIHVGQPQLPSTFSVGLKDSTKRIALALAWPPAGNLGWDDLIPLTFFKGFPTLNRPSS